MANSKANVLVGIFIFIFLSSQVLARDIVDKKVLAHDEEREPNHLNADHIHNITSDVDESNSASHYYQKTRDNPSNLNELDAGDILIAIDADESSDHSPITAAFVHYYKKTSDNLSNLNHLDNDDLNGGSFHGVN
uniref:Nodule-specific protein n=1 Tax=Astragalus sinicus TaxID=47065 RepID=Q07A31_ASTSI|nr:nodule-specific protein [Astragalus sinicus]